MPREMAVTCSGERKPYLLHLKMYPFRLRLRFLAESRFLGAMSVLCDTCLVVYLSVPMNAAAIEFRKHAMLGSRGLWGQTLRSLVAGAGGFPGTGVGDSLVRVADPNYLDDLLNLSCIHISALTYSRLLHPPNLTFPPSSPDA